MARLAALCVLLFVVVFAFAEAEDEEADLFPSVHPHVMAEITPEVIDAHMTYLSSPSLEGRMTGSSGELAAAHYLVQTMMAAGVRPGAPDGSWFQKVPLENAHADVAGPMVFSKEGATSVSVPYNTGWVGHPQLRTPQMTFTEEDLIFVGYGTVDAAKGWDDFKGYDVTGKIIVTLLGQPLIAPFSRAFYEYSGRYTYKMEQASLHGAKGVIFINNSTVTSAQWTAISNVHGYTEVQMPEMFPAVNPLALYGWLQAEVGGAALAQFCGTTMWDLVTMANNASFVPVKLAAKMSISNTYSFVAYNGTTVAGKIKGKNHPHKVVVLSAHVDHLGMDTSTTPPKVYTGALDNASGMSCVLAAATALGHRYGGRHPRGHLHRTILFLFPTAEEYGLMGATYFIKHKPAKWELLADVNYDIANGFGATTDSVIVGSARSTLGSEVMPWALAQDNMTMTPGELFDNLGFLYRSDAYAFDRAGIPSVFIISGMYFVDHPRSEVYPTGYFWSFGLQWLSAPMAYGGCYHQTCDTWPAVVHSPYWGNVTITVDGIVQNARTGARAVFAIANSHFTPVKLV